MDRYYADLNPRYGARYERRYAVMQRNPGGPGTPVYGMHYATRQAAERNAAKLNEQERDPEVDAPAPEAKRPAKLSAVERGLRLAVTHKGLRHYGRGLWIGADLVGFTAQRLSLIHI